MQLTVFSSGEIIKFLQSISFRKSWNLFNAWVTLVGWNRIKSAKAQSTKRARYFGSTTLETHRVKGNDVSLWPSPCDLSPWLWPRRWISALALGPKSLLTSLVIVKDSLRRRIISKNDNFLVQHLILFIIIVIIIYVYKAHDPSLFYIT